jgi:hypothetical protein
MEILNLVLVLDEVRVTLKEESRTHMLNLSLKIMAVKINIIYLPKLSILSSGVYANNSKK